MSVFRFTQLSIVTTCFIIMGLSPLAHSQNGIKVVPIGESIKPESSSSPKRKRRRYRTPVVKQGTEFLVSLGTAVSSGLSKSGDIITLYAAENVGRSSSRPGIVQGALGRGIINAVDKKAKTLSIQLESIEAYNNKLVPISGMIELVGEGKTSANASYGDHFSATLGEKIVVRSRPKKTTEPEALTAFMELEGKKAEANLAKGKSKGRVKMVIEAPKGSTAEDINIETVALTKVNGTPLAVPVKPMARSPKIGDENKNGIMDVSFWFNAWDFIKNQPKQSNTITVTGQMQNGEIFRATGRVGIDY